MPVTRKARETPSAAELRLRLRVGFLPQRTIILPKYSGAIRARTNGLLVANHGVPNYLIDWPALGGRVGRITVPFKQAARPGVASNCLVRERLRDCTRRPTQ